MSGKQHQSVTDGGQAIQATGNVTVGMSRDDMLAIMREVTTTIMTFRINAEETAEKRINELREELVERFAGDEKANTEAFASPDFQAVLRDAQYSYARSGDASVRNTLVEIIARRSAAPEASREALALDDAAARAARLTHEEFSALSLCYLLRYSQKSIANVQQFTDFINDELIVFAKGTSVERSSYWHIESQGCGRLGIGEFNLRDLLIRSYGAALGLGFALDDYQKVVPDLDMQLLRPIMMRSHRNEEMVQPAALNKESFLELGTKGGLTKDQVDLVWGKFEESIPPNLAELLRPDCPDIDILLEMCQGPLKGLELNSSGIAIAHANAVRVIGLNASLGVWIK